MLLQLPTLNRTRWTRETQPMVIAAGEAAATVVFALPRFEDCHRDVASEDGED